MEIYEIEAEIKKLPSRDRAALAKWIVESLDELSETEIEALWAEEAERRLDELEQGLATEVPAGEVLRPSAGIHLVKPVTFHPEAGAEVMDAVEYYENRVTGLGFDLIGEVERAIEQISESPEASQMIGRRARRKPLWRFPYNIIYAAYTDRIRIVAFAHQKRRPFYWCKRLGEA